MSTRLQLALEKVNAFIAGRPELSIDSDPLPPHPGANSEVLFGHYNQEPIVFKVFGDSIRKPHEKKVLQLFAETGYGPELLPFETESILIMQRFPGKPFFMCEEELRSTPHWAWLFRQLGIAVAVFVETAPGAAHASCGQQDMLYEPGHGIENELAFYWKANLETFFDAVCDLSAKALAERTVPYNELLSRSLSDIRAHRETILSFPSFIFMDDFHYNNIIVDGSTLQGFIDFEMTRYGNEVIALAAFMSSLCNYSPECWIWFRQGYEDRRGRPLESEIVSLVAIVAPFTHWIRFMWYWGPVEPPRWTVKNNVRAKKTDEIKATVELMKQIDFT